MKKYTITMLGPSGCGKTAYMLGLYRSMGLFSLELDNSGCGRFGLSHSGTTKEQAETIDWFFEHDFNHSGLVWPPGTDDGETPTWEFAIEWNDLTLASWEWMDYTGREIRKTIRANAKGGKQTAIEGRLKMSDAVIIVVDSIIFSQDNLQAISVEAEAMLVNWVFENVFLKSQKFPEVVLFVLTKINSDLVQERFTQNNCKELHDRIGKVFEKTIRYLKDKIPAENCRIVAVDVGGRGQIRDEWQQNGSPDSKKLHSKILVPPSSYHCEVPLLCCFDRLFGKEYGDLRSSLIHYKATGRLQRAMEGVLDFLGGNGKERHSPAETQARLMVLDPVLEKIGRYVENFSSKAGYWR
ncbi:MAG TPA: hypothetical protein VGJ73_18915 [Verrucomicrobiae bacterium]|jgi:GTPase SAR1 family protein